MTPAASFDPYPNLRRKGCRVSVLDGRRSEVQCCITSGALAHARNGQLRQFGCGPVTSGLPPRTTDIIRPPWHVSNVPTANSSNCASLDHLVGAANVRAEFEIGLPPHSPRAGTSPRCQGM